MSIRVADFVADVCARDGLSAAVADYLLISSTGVRRDSRGTTPTGCGADAVALRGRSTQIAGDDLPVVAVQAGGGKVQHDAPHGGL